MNREIRLILSSAVFCLLSACVLAKPESRLHVYLNASELATKKPSMSAAGLEAGLLVIHDVESKGSPPPMPAEALALLTEQTRQRMEGGLPLKVVKALPPLSSAPTSMPYSPEQAAQEQGVEYLVIAVLSSVETDEPGQLAFDGSQQGGGAMGTISGTTTVEYALVEVALLHTKTGRTIIRAEGRAWATLEQLERGLASNAYPVIRRSGRTERIFPPRDDAGARAMLRGVAASEALEQAVYKLKQVWDQLPSA